MKVRLLAFASARDAIGSGELDVELQPEATLEMLLRDLEDRYPQLAAIRTRLAIAVNGEIVEDLEIRPEPGSEIALLPPVSGGSPIGAVELTDEPIDLQSCGVDLDPSIGATVIFLGTVRGGHGAKTVTGITYDAYREMATKTLEAIVAELERTSPKARARIVHRLGPVATGEASIAIAVATAHRQEAYAISREILERVKREVPIWKLEHYSDGTSAWREEEPLRAESIAHPQLD